MTPTWYDVLGVEPVASPEEIEAAWRAAIADVGPGDRRFRTMSDAAEILLDPARRAAYDTSLPDPAADLQPEPVSEPETETEPASEPAIDDVLVESVAEGVDEAVPRRGVPAWVLALLAVLTALMLACAGYLLTQPSDDSIASGTAAAQTAAERSVVTVLAYDYRTLDQDQSAADELMTKAYRAKYDQLFTQIKANAPDLKAVVTCEVIASGVVGSGEDRVQVLVFVNRPTERADLSTPRVYRDQVVMTMVRSGRDWLVGDLQTNQLAQ